MTWPYDPVDMRVDNHGHTYFVYVDGRLYDSMSLRHGPRLTWAQMRDIEAGYREGLTCPQN